MADLTYHQIAEILDGVQYREEDSDRELMKYCKEHRYVVAFGASDDLLELCGAINDELGAWEGGEYYINAKGEITYVDEEVFQIDPPRYVLKLHWCKTEEICWTFETDIPHAKFTVWEDDEKYGEGIVFSLDHLSQIG